MDIEEIKSRLNIVEVIGGYIKLLPAGSNFKGLCPFHNERTPSFMVNEERQVFHCFGCGKGGDVIAFVQEIEGMEFIEALRLLADRAGVKLEGYREDKGKREGKSRARLAMSRAVEIYEESLRSPEGERGYRYLEERGLKEEYITKFSLGFARDEWSHLLDRLESEGFTANELIEAGLAVRSSKDPNRAYDRFRARIMFPICSSQGDTIGFSGRVLPGDTGEMGKYVNTPQTSLYDKSRALYGIHLAKLAIKKRDLAILLEGNMDVAMSHQAGVDNAVATCGTAVTFDQLNILKRYSKNIAFAFDADQAGISASYKGIELAIKSGLNVLAINISEAGSDFKDVSDIVAVSPEKWRVLAEKPLPIMDYFFKTVFDGRDMERVSEKREAVEELIGKIALLGNKVDQAHYIEKLSESARINTRTLYDILLEKHEAAKRQYQKEYARQEQRDEKINVLADTDKTEKIANRIIALVLFYSELIPSIKKKEVRRLFAEELSEDITRVFQIITESGVRFSDPDSYLKLIHDDRLKTKVARLITIAENHFASYNEGRASEQLSPSDELARCIKELKEGSRKKKLDILSEKIKNAEASHNQDLPDLLREYSRLMKKS